MAIGCGIGTRISIRSYWPVCSSYVRTYTKVITLFDNVKSSCLVPTEILDFHGYYRYVCLTIDKTLF